VTNAIQSLNNLNNNEMDRNKEANGVNNNRLNDDRLLYIWDIADHVSSVTLDSPRLEMDSASNWFMMYGNNSNRLYMNNNGTVTQVDQTYNRFHNAIVGYD